MPLKLNQMLALRKGHQASAHVVISEIHKTHQKPGLFTGHSKVYQPDDESGEQLFPESSQIQQNVDTLLAEVKKELVQLFDSTATVEYANCHATGDIVLKDGTALLKAVPVTYLLFLEKQLTDLHTLVSKIPRLDPAETWTYDDTRGCYVTQPTLTTRTKAVIQPLVKYHATKEHPAQVDTYTEQKPIGKYYLTKFSSAAPADRVKELTERVVMLQEAVKVAREEANTAVVTKQEVGEKILGWLFA